MKAPKNPLLAILIIINTLIAVFLLFNQYSINDEVDKSTTKSSPPVQKPIQSPYIPKAPEGKKIVEYPFGDFAINLARPSGPQRFIKISITLLVQTPIDKDLTEIINKTPTLRDEIISIFNNQTPQDILKLEGRGVLKNILQKHINSQLKDDEILRILFTKFTVS